MLNRRFPGDQFPQLASLALMFADAPDAMLVTDGPTGRIVLANAAACALTGYAAEDLTGRRHVDLHMTADQERAESVFQSVRLARSGTRLTASLRRADDAILTVDIAAHAVRDAGQDFVVAVVRPRDGSGDDAVRRLREQNAMLEKRFAERTGELTVANQQLTRTITEANQRALALQRTGRQRTQFFAGLAHEMRTPLNAVTGLADLLTDMKLPDDARHTARLIHSSARAMVRLINDLMDHSRLEAGKLELVCNPYNLRDLLGEIADITAVQCDDLGLTFALQIEGELPDPVAGDEGRLRQVLMNLVGNALKFTRDGGVTLHVRAVQTKDSRVTVEFRVTDTGIGISPNEQEQLFQPYSQAAGGIAAGTGSSGLGLAICRMLVERMGGRIGMQSDEGWGSTFWFTLPLESAADHAVDAPQPAARDRATIAGLSALLAEDNRINQQVAVGMLRRLGVSVQVAGDGQAALTLLAATRFDVIFMDVQMPGMDGLEATRALRAGQVGELNRRTPVIAMTGNVSKEDRDACTAAGMTDYVAKPISGERLQQAMGRAMSAPVPGIGTPAAAFDLGILAEQLDGDRDLAGEIFTLFLDDARERIGLMAVAVKAYDCDTVVCEAKSLEGAALNVHAVPMAKQAAAVGAAARHRECDYAQALIGEMATSLDELAVAWQLTVG